jgi:hypothetical protein
MSLTQFGAVLSFAIDLEDKIAKYYEESTSKFDARYSDELLSRSNSAKKRKKKLEKTRRENVTEMTLEPIEGLTEENYKIDLSDFSFNNINSLEVTISRFYVEAGPKINVLESQRIFKKCYVEHGKYQMLE